MVGVHSVRRRGRFISPVYVCCCFVVGNSLCSCMFVGVSWLVIRCVRVCLCRLVVGNVYAGTINRPLRWVFVVYMVNVRSVYSGCS